MSCDTFGSAAGRLLCGDDVVTTSCMSVVSVRADGWASTPSELTVSHTIKDSHVVGDGSRSIGHLVFD